MSSTPTLSTTNCSECGRPIDIDSHFCQYCGFEMPGEEKKTDTEREVARREKSELPIFGGALIIASSVFLFITVWLARDEPDEVFMLDWWPNWFQWLMVFFGIIGIIGGVSAMARRSQAVALAGGLLSCFGLGMVLGVIGLALVAASEREFKSALADFTEPEEEIDNRALEKVGFGWRR